MMNLKDFLIKKRSAILNEWIDAVFESYPAETAKMLKSKNNQFQNPVGYNISNGLEILFDELIGGFDSAKMKLPLEKIIKIRAIQDFSASDAVLFIFQLKEIVRNYLGNEIAENNLYNDLKDFDVSLDRLALMTFDQYMQTREKLYQIKLDQAKSGSIKVIDRLNKRLQDENGVNDKIEDDNTINI